MFGYVNVYKPELKVKEFYKYKGYYCGLCRTLQEKYGRLGQMTLTYDMTFLVVLLTSLYESETVRAHNRCLVHPIKRQEQLRNKITAYAADMNIAMTYHHLMDDWKDQKSPTGLLGAKAFKGQYKKIAKQYPHQCEVIEMSLKQLHHFEKRNEDQMDLVAGRFGTLMAELFVIQEDQWSVQLRNIGFFLGKFIYILDAYEDLEADLKKHNYNPFWNMYQNTDYEAAVNQMLVMMMAECTSAFERLPCVLDVEIIRNILYQGVWTKYNQLQNKNSLKDGQENDRRSL